MKRGDIDLDLMSDFQIEVMIRLLRFLHVRKIGAYFRQFEIKEPMTEGERCYLTFYADDIRLKIQIYFDELAYIFEGEEGAVFERIRGETDESISKEFFEFLQREFKERGIGL